MPLILQGATSGQATLQATDAATVTLTLPATSGTLVTTGGAQTIEFADGSAAAPSITNSGDTNTGIFFPAADTIAFTEGGTEAMRLTSAGDVGIGITNPAQKLDVFGQVKFGTSAGRYFQFITDSSSSYLDVSHAINFRVNGASSLTTAATIDTSGNVGIGTASAGARLHVQGGSGLFQNAGAIVQINSTTAAQPAYLLLSNSTDASNSFIFCPNKQLGIVQSDTSASSIVYFSTQNTERMRIDSSGNLLVGTTSNIAAGAKIYARGNGVGIAVGYGTGNAEYRHMYMNSGDGTLYFFNPTNFAYLTAAGAWTNASDARLKKNITDIKYGLADVLKAQPRSYEMNSVDGNFVGFIAQELQTVIPEVVTGDPEKQLGVDYGSLVAVAFKAIQELKATVDAQAARIAALEGAK